MQEIFNHAMGIQDQVDSIRFESADIGDGESEDFFWEPGVGEPA
jgi:hypothetical protein